MDVIHVWIMYNMLNKTIGEDRWSLSAPGK